VSDATSVLAGWENFYVIVGSSAAALIGLQFVVIALIAETAVRRSVGTINAFGTPIVVHLGSALVVSATLSAPWPSLFATSAVLTVFSVAGFAYSLNIFLRARRQDLYAPVLEDWIFHMTLPCLAYGGLIVAAQVLRYAPRPALFVIASSALGLLLLGIRNAWDSMIFIVAGDPQDGSARTKKEGESSA
jgi:hypothetical protein